MTETLATRVQRRLDDLNLSPITAATAAGLPRDTIRDIVRGKSLRPSHATLLRVAKALSCTTEELTGEKPESSSEFFGPVLEAHQLLDWQICLLFSDLARLHSEEASIIYFALGSSARIQVLKELKQLRYPDLHEIYWRSLMVEIQRADDAYNEFRRHSRTYSGRYSQQEFQSTFDLFTDVHMAVILFKLAIGRGFTVPHGPKALEVPLVIPAPEGHPFAEFLKEASGAKDTLVRL